HIVIKNFWEIVHAMTYDQKKKLLMFVTASDRVPLKSLGNLTFVIQRNGPDTDRLPTALTCFGRLLLPEYSTKE
ncbi:HECT-domain-containing protein, partial [Neocallimastix californiae]